jgi:hypothetical protein
METCPKKPKLKAMKKTMSALDKATKYTTTDLPKNIGLKELKQEGYDAIVKLTEGQAKTKLRELQLLPSRSVKERECYKCGTRFRWQKKINKHRCTNWECDTRVAQLALTYTPLWHMHRGGTMSYKTFLKALYIFALKIPQDSARHILGCGYDSAENWFQMFRLATAYAELFKGRSMHFPDGTVEFDATKTVINRSSSNKKNTHCGRFLVIYHRESGAYALEPLPDKAVLKGAPPPPESYDEVHTPIRKKVHNGHVLSADSGKAFKKTHKIHFEDKGIPLCHCRAQEQAVLQGGKDSYHFALEKDPQPSCTPANHKYANVPLQSRGQQGGEHLLRREAELEEDEPFSEPRQGVRELPQRCLADQECGFGKGGKGFGLLSEGTHRLDPTC